MDGCSERRRDDENSSLFTTNDDILSVRVRLDRRSLLSIFKFLRRSDRSGCLTSASFVSPDGAAHSPRSLCFLATSSTETTASNPGMKSCSRVRPLDRPLPPLAEFLLRRAPGVNFSFHSVPFNMHCSVEAMQPIQHGRRGTVSTPSRDSLGGDDERLGRSCRAKRGMMGDSGSRCTMQGCNGRLVGSEELKERALIDRLGGGVSTPDTEKDECAPWTAGRRK